MAFVLSPYGPFVYLAWLRAIGLVSAVALICASAVIHIGLVSVLAQTNEEKWQPWLVLLLGSGLYCLGVLQYAVGERRQLWSPAGRRLWRIFGWCFGVFLVLAMLAQVAVFHLGRALGHR